MYREVVRSSGCFHAPETKCDAPGGNKAHQAAVHLRRSVPEPNVHSEFKMDGVGKVAQCTWQGAHQISVDHKSGFHNVPLHPDSWTYFGIYWKGVYYVWTVLCFGWCGSPYIYHTLSSAVAQYLRHLDVPITTWLDDFWMSNFQATKTQSPAQQREAAREVASLALLTVSTSAVISCRSPSACSNLRHGWCS